MYEQDHDREIERLADEFDADRGFSHPPEPCTFEEFAQLHGYRAESHWYDC